MANYRPLPHLSPVRRVITGHDNSGTANFDLDEKLTPVAVAASADAPMGFTLIHRTTEFPVDNQGGSDEFGPENLQRSRFPRGIVCEVVDVPPAGTSQPHFHRNVSLDYGVIMEGTLDLILDGGAKRTLHTGDVYVQRGTIHGWSNPGDKVCRFMTVIVPAQIVVVQSTGEALGSTKLPGLTD
ncbi:uncharacterized protein AB675_2614 [Cyphellophora attinorum]|uniref:Cupin type-2 domain-containing protein n=1 Tax=Cyphellophora attinorum TaxID=1664694 RepID=A0A0N1HAG8_9EURO|nr:uncharacterized protein AB675_2614 [Phialophora attinorum]KPI44926.1 hypothetical protein AB675_2614 [Phialophora attinorum]